jgi:transcriptional regulator with XRE-family HTH domain
MARKGDRAYLEPQAQRLYADGRTLSDIAGLLGVSVTSLARWKEESKVPSADMDEWDRARLQKRSNIQRLRDLFEDQLAHLEALRADERTAPMMDVLSKVGSLLERWDKIERTQQVVEAVFKDGESSRVMTPELLQAEIKKVYGV